MWFQIPAPHTRWIFFTFISFSIVLMFKKNVNKRIRGREWPILKCKDVIWTLCCEQPLWAACHGHHPLNFEQSVLVRSHYVTSSDKITPTDHNAPSVTRFCKISPLWQYFKSLGQFCEGLFSILTLPWQFCYAIGPIFSVENSQSLTKIELSCHTACTLHLMT